MGDDLNFAQKFTRTAADGLALLAEMPDPRAETESPVVINMMTTVQRGAKRLRARHIYVGAQDVLSALHHENDATLNGRIETLGSLVTEYARGLDELLTEAQPVTSIQNSTTDKWTIARETLNTMLPTADPETADVLSRLMRAPVTLETVQPHIADETKDAQIVSFAPAQTSTASGIENDHEGDLIQMETSVFETNDTALVGSQDVDTPERETIEPETVTLDAMMRDVIADALCVARSIGRTISLSYDMGERSVSEAIATSLRLRLGKALSQIIRQALTDDRVGHIDVNLAGEQLHVMAGTTAMRVAINPKDKPAPKRLITQETEQGLRNQLDALMDPIAFHETAS